MMKVAAGVLIAALVGAGGYALGAATAPTEDDAVSAREDARAESYAEAKATANDEAQALGFEAGKEVGSRSGELVGTGAGDAEGSGSASAELAAAEAAERAENCGAPLFVEGYCPTDEEIAYENQAESLCGGRHYDEAAAQGIDCGPGTSPRP